jgi:hypothetical protein
MSRQCPVNMALKLYDVLDFTTHDIFIGELVQTYADSGVLTDGTIGIAKLRPLLFDMASKKYWSLGHATGKCWNAGKALKSCFSANRSFLDAGMSRLSSDIRFQVLGDRLFAPCFLSGCWYDKPNNRETTADRERWLHMTCSCGSGCAEDHQNATWLSLNRLC